jgi:hypothetical protein
MTRLNEATWEQVLTRLQPTQDKRYLHARLDSEPCTSERNRDWLDSELGDVCTRGLLDRARPGPMLDGETDAATVGDVHDPDAGWRGARLCEPGTIALNPRPWESKPIQWPGCCS